MSKENKNDNSEKLYSDTAYDDAFRTLITKCDDILIPFINYVFKEDYPAGTKIIRLQNEQFLDRENEADKKKISDLFFGILHEGSFKKYHIECESNNGDDSLLIKMIEYDTQIALVGENTDQWSLRIRFPYSSLLLLRGSNIPVDKGVIIIETPKGSVSYSIPIILVSDFDIDTLFEQRLYLLIPFFIFTFEKELNAINDNPERILKLEELYQDIMHRLNEEHKNGALSSLSHHVIIKLTYRVFLKLTEKQSEVNRKVGDIMGGNVLDLEEFRIYDAAKAECAAELKAKDEALQASYDENQQLKEEIKQLQGECKMKCVSYR